MGWGGDGEGVIMEIRPSDSQIKPTLGRVLDHVAANLQVRVRGGG
jgi:hypothetical protein